VQIHHVKRDTFIKLVNSPSTDTNGRWKVAGKGALGAAKLQGEVEASQHAGNKHVGWITQVVLVGKSEMGV
jgi:hypothetical protein